MEDKDLIFFELNNWFPDKDYPCVEPIETWMLDENLNFGEEDWVKENKLCVVEDIIDQSFNFCITATKEWAEKNCPKLLTEEKCKKFLRSREEDGHVYGRFGSIFREYTDDNIGIYYEPGTGLDGK